MKISNFKFDFLRIYILWILIFSIWTIPAQGAAQYPEIMDDETEIQSSTIYRPWLWMGGAALVGGIAGFIAGKTQHSHSHSHNEKGEKGSKGSKGSQGLVGPIGPIGPGGGPNPFLIAPGSLTVTLTLNAFTIAEAFGTIDTYLITPNGVVIPLATDIPFPSVTIFGSGGNTTIPNPSVGTYTIIADISNASPIPITIPNVGVATVTYSLGETQSIILPELILNNDSKGQTSQIFGFSTAIFTD